MIRMVDKWVRRATDSVKIYTNMANNILVADGNNAEASAIAWDAYLCNSGKS